MLTGMRLSSADQLQHTDNLNGLYPVTKMIHSETYDMDDKEWVNQLLRQFSVAGSAHHPPSMG